MPGRDRSFKSHVVYPGASRKLGFHQDTQHYSSNTSENKSNTKTAISITPDATLESSSVEEVSNQVNKSFDLKWIDYKYENNFPSKTPENRTKSLGTTSRQDRPEIKLPKFNLLSANIDQNLSRSGSARSNLSANLSSVQQELSRKMDSGSTALDMGDDLMTTPSNDYYDDSNLDGQLIDGAPEVKQRLSDDYNHLDEPILDTLLRDLTGIYNKMKIIALPLSSYDIYKIVLRGWDLWGPLMLCTFLAFNLHHSTSQEGHSGPHFADIFVLVWFGSCLVSLNYRLLSITSANNQLVANHSRSIAQQQPTSSVQEDGNPDDALAAKERNQSDIMMPPHYDTTFRTLLSPPSIFQLMCVFGYCLVAPCFGLILLKLLSFDRLFFERIIIGLIFGFGWPTFCSVRILIRYQHPDKRALAIYPIGLFYFILSCMIILNH